MTIKKIIILFLTFGSFSLLCYDTEVFANNDRGKYNEIFERKFPQTFHYKNNYEDLYQFIHISEKEYRTEWNSGKTISEIARERGIFPEQLILYLAEKRFEALDKALNKGEIDRYFYYDYAISHMKRDILEFINRNPKKQGK